MLKKYLIFTLLVIILLFKFDASEAKNKILFKINNETITTVDLIQETKYLLNTNKDLENTKSDVIYEIAKKTLMK